MSYFKLFFLLFFLIHNIAYSANTTVTQKTKTATKTTKSVKAKKQIVRTMLEKKKKEAIKARPTQLTATYQISNKTINLKSPMCQYAQTNDVISLKKALLSSNYSESEVNTICKNGESLFMIAVKNNNYLTAKLLIEKGANINLQNDAEVSPLHIISRIDTHEIDKIFSLIISNKKLNLNVKDLEGYTPLMRAVEFEKLSVIKQLVKMNADLDVKNNYGLNVIEIAKNNLEGKKTDEERAISQKIIDILNKDD